MSGSTLSLPFRRSRCRPPGSGGIPLLFPSLTGVIDNATDCAVFFFLFPGLRAPDDVGPALHVFFSFPSPLAAGTLRQSADHGPSFPPSSEYSSADESLSFFFGRRDWRNLHSPSLVFALFSAREEKWPNTPPLFPFPPQPRNS